MPSATTPAGAVVIPLTLEENLTGEHRELAAAMVLHGTEPVLCECGERVRQYVEDEEGVRSCLSCFQGELDEGFTVVKRMGVTA